MSRTPEMLCGPRESLLPNLCVPAPWLFGRDRTLVMWPLTPPWMYLHGRKQSVLHPGSDIINDLDKPIDLDGHILSPFYPREIIYQNCTFLSIAHLMCYRYAVINNQKTFATGIRKWSRPLRDFPTPKFSTTTEIDQWIIILEEIYAFLCINNSEIRSSLVRSGPRPFTVAAKSPCQMGTRDWHSHPPAGPLKMTYWSTYGWPLHMTDWKRTPG